MFSANNERLMGHIAHLNNQFKSINTFERSYTSMFSANNERLMGHIAHLNNQFKSINAFERSYEDVGFVLLPRKWTVKGT